MKITKFAHSCLLVEENDTRILLDPGSWNTTPDVQNLNALLITHEHADHFSLEQVQEILSKNPEAKVITHAAVGKLLDDAGIAHTILEEGESILVANVSIQSVGHDHAVIYGGVSPCRNTGYFIAERLFVPGDALHDLPPTPVEILALPTGGPWMKLADAIDYAKAVNPKVVFPIHDAMYIDSYQRELIPRIMSRNLESVGITFREMFAGSTEEF